MRRASEPEPEPEPESESEPEPEPGAPRQLQLLQELRTEVLRPIVRYKELVGALSGLADVQALSAAPPNSAMAGLRDAVERDEERLAQLESLFALLDRDRDGRLSTAELEASVAALSPAAATEQLPTPLAELLERLRGAGQELDAAEVDLATFVRIMLTKAVADYTAPDAELLPVFEALDRNGDGSAEGLGFKLGLRLGLGLRLTLLPVVEALDRNVNGTNPNPDLNRGRSLSPRPRPSPSPHPNPNPNA